MTLRNNEPNSLSVLNKRKLDFCPIHFEKVILNNVHVSAKLYENWLYEHTDGRFYCSKVPNRASVEIGFEIHSEATFFVLKQSEIIPDSLAF